MVSRGGPKLAENRSAADAEQAMRDGELFRIHAVHVPVKDLVEELGDPNHGAGRPVFDKTGLAGFYDFDIAWAPNDLSVATADGAAPNPDGPSVFNALERQLGLKLEPGTAPFDTVVIDHAERPSRN